MKINLEKFDTSNFNIINQHIPFQNKAALGLMKDELCGKTMIEYVGLRAKMYAVRVEDEWMKKAKGIKRAVVEMITKIAFITKLLYLSNKTYSNRSNTEFIQSARIN